jgi:hypothetical protein
MHPLLNKIILETIGEFDFLALLALTETSETFCHFIRDHAVGLNNLCRFLQQNQYAFHHDGEGILFSKNDIFLLLWAFKVVKDRHGDALYNKVVGFLGPFISATLATRSKHVLTIWKPERRNIRLSGSTHTHHWHNRGVRIVATDEVQRIGWHWMEQGIVSNWMHASPRDWYAREVEECYSDWENLFQNFKVMVDSDFLFCKRFHDDSCAVKIVWKELPDEIWELKKSMSVTEIIHAIYVILSKAGMDIELLKGNLQIFIQRVMSKGTYSLHFTVEDFYTLFEQPWWMELWTPADLGWWCSELLWKYERIVSRLFEQCFTSRCDALLWFFLGGYYLNQRDDRCKILVDQDFIGDMVKSVSTENRVWLVENIVELAPEFGVSSELGEMLFMSFVLTDTDEAELMMSILFKATSKSRMWPLFYASISTVARTYEMHQMFQRLVTGANAQPSNTLNPVSL